MSRSSKSLQDPKGILPPLQTPCFVVPTEYGLIPNIPPDLSGDVPLFFSAGDFIDSPLPKSITPLEGLGLGKRWIFFGPGASFFNFDEGPKKEGIALYCINGNQRVISKDEYKELVNWIKPNCTISLYSQISPLSKSRQKQLRINAAKSYAENYENTINYAHGLSQHGESGLFAQFTQFTDKEAKIIQTAIDNFNKDLPRIIQFLGHPVETRLAYKTGFDIFIATLPVYYARNGFALNFDFQNTTEEDLGIDIRDRKFEHDHTPIVEGCTCSCCRNYKKSYIHHLLNVREILGIELLVTHNIHYYQEFIKSLPTLKY